MSLKGIRKYFILSSLIITFVVFSFIGFIKVSSIQTAYTESVINSYNVVAKETANKIQYAVKYGKVLQKFYGINDLLGEFANYAKDVSDVRVILPNGSIAYSLVNASGAESMTLVRQAFSSNIADSNSVNYKNENGKYHIFISIYDDNNTVIGALDVIFPSSIIQNQVNVYLNNMIKQISIIIALSLILTIIALIFVPLSTSEGKLNQKNIMVIFISLLVIGQLYLGIEDYFVFKNNYMQNVKQNTLAVAKIVQSDIESVIKKGVALNELYGINSWLSTIIQSVPEIGDIYISDANNNVIYGTKDVLPTNLTSSPYNQTLTLNAGNTIANENVLISQDYINKKLLNIVLDTATTIIISLIVMTESIFFMFQVIEKKKTKEEKNNKNHQIAQNKLVRPLAFLFTFAGNMPLAFIPIMMQRFHLKIAGFSDALISGLPVCTQVLGTIISILIASYVTKKSGWKVTFILGLVICSSGTIFAGLANNGWLFILAYFICGLGYGLSWMSLRSFTTIHISEMGNSSGFNLLSAGIMSGITCGTVVGTIIADRLGYSMVFFISIFFFLIAFIFCSSLIHNSKDKQSSTSSINKQKSKTMSLLREKKLIFFLIMVCLPSTICSSFVTYTFPLFATQMNVGSSDIGRAFLLNGLTLIYIGPLLGKFFTTASGIKKAIIYSSIMYALSLLVFGLYIGILTAFVAVVLLGISDSLGISSQISYSLDMHECKKFDSGIVLLWFSIFYKLGQFLGPLILGILISLGTNIGMCIAGIITLVLLIIYILFNERRNFAT